MDMDISMDWATSVGWPKAMDDVDLLLQGLGPEGTFNAGLAVGPASTSSAFRTVPFDHTATGRITELDDEAAPSALAAETSGREGGTEHVRAALGLVGLPSRGNDVKNSMPPEPVGSRGPCMNCLALTVPVIRKLPCLRWIITDSSLYREQSKPYQLFSTRWQSMDLVDIDTWASSEVRRIRLSQIYLDAPYEVEVREFVPVEGDMLEEKWTSNGVTRSHRIPRYALADMEKSAAVLQAFIQDNIARYICGTVGQSDELIWQTYFFAFRHAQSAKTPTERELVLNAFRFWVACRKTSNPEHILGDDKLGGEPVNDPSSVFYGRVPMPVIMIAQMECILYSRVLRPVHKKLLDQLNFLVKENKRQYWLTLYLTLFILLHSCAMVSRRDWETARQYNLRDEYCNHESISKHQSGVNVMLAHFHYLNKGVHPFRMTYDAAGLRKLSNAAELNDTQLAFVKLTSHLLREPSRVAEIASVRARRDFNHDLYWVAQLYEENWVPGPTA
ncbi:dc7b8959-bb24-4bdd-88c8-e08b8e00ba17 [Thermothielavioides terrestris]|uniref:Dc7b8959-bb24-4bdd-88c8-e08b8e00ba17 n=1 Tax=Thermothielavioides terrestris TaxID=2587410 RepID=A0A446BXH9_9PEZI|nr:dc7b8959-bb24-4bdd-88c8-e08b8e00ba17 [Thermothielavioides terrestris]